LNDSKWNFPFQAVLKKFSCRLAPNLSQNVLMAGKHGDAVLRMKPIQSTRAAENIIPFAAQI
jgi:hypothetical protein